MIYATLRANANGSARTVQVAKHTDLKTWIGFYSGNTEWANFGQGAPEVGAIPGGSERPKTIDLASMGDDIHECVTPSSVSSEKLIRGMHEQIRTHCGCQRA